MRTNASSQTDMIMINIHMFIEQFSKGKLCKLETKLLLLAGYTEICIIYKECFNCLAPLVTGVLPGSVIDQHRAR